jgi:hypothetical protein
VNWRNCFPLWFWERLAVHRHQGAGQSMFDLLKDLWAFARERKKFWLLPLVVSLLLIGLLVALAQYSVVSPFIYTLF